ncbi:MAG: sensor histidine kinase [Alphaproteobacteria bacterium]
MIDNIKKALVIKYTLIMLFILVIVFLGNYFVIVKILDQTKISSLEEYLQEEADESLPYLLQHQNNAEPSLEINYTNSEEYLMNIFCAWLDNKDNIIFASGLSENLIEEKKEIMLNWKHQDHELIEFEVKNASGNNLMFLMASKKIYKDGKYIGRVFVGKNITFINLIMEEYFSFVVILILTMIGLTFYLANHMAKKAMIPIAEALNKQNCFVADASHEMRTPLSVMLSSIDLFQTTSKKNIEIKNTIKNEILNMRELVSELLDLARFDLNKKQIKIDFFNFAHVVKETCEKIQFIAHEKNIKIHFQTYSSTIYVNADENKIRQVIYIFLDNAIKYSNTDKNIYISLEQQKNNVTFKIKDEGIGISKEEQKQIFTRFYRVNKARSRNIGGSGLGLSIAYEIINLHNSKIEIESDGKSGSCFSFSLKIKKP